MSIRMTLRFLFIFVFAALGAFAYGQSDSKPASIVATFEGHMLNDGGLDPVLTTFTIQGSDRLSGTYVIEDENNAEAGSLSAFQWEGSYTVNCVWRDKHGSGHLRILFAADFRSFRGFWGESADTTSFPWDGVRKD